MKELPLLSVAMATYNGANYLARQLDSIITQSYSNIEIIVCDDNSTDGTLAILERYKQKHNLSYYVNTTRLGVIKNFERALSFATGSYIAFADQDDVWLPDKLEKSHALLHRLEQKIPAGMPALVFTDLTVVDDKLATLHHSYWKYMHLKPAKIQINHLLVENVATGCTMLFNRSALTKALPIPHEALMHDVWLLLVTTYFGEVAFLREQTVLYRQHNLNVVGAHKAGLRTKLASGSKKLVNKNIGLLHKEVEQAQALIRNYNTALKAYPEKEAMLNKFARLKTYGFLKRKYEILKNGFYSSSFLKAINVLLRA